MSTPRKSLATRLVEGLDSYPGEATTDDFAEEIEAAVERLSPVVFKELSRRFKRVEDSNLQDAIVQRVLEGIRSQIDSR